VLLNITLFGDLSAAGESDQIEDTINYRTVTKEIIKHVESSKRFTVEALASDVARICLKEKGVLRARVRVEKPGALRFARSVGVEIERTADDFA
jgi:FolB domain-containing protein